jgi:uncharacterized protein YacL
MVGQDMLEQLRGRNLAHVGCTIGLTLGLLVGLVVALVIVQLVRLSAAVGWATFAWFAVTFGLGAIGFYLGSRATRRLWGDDLRKD